MSCHKIGELLEELCKHPAMENFCTLLWRTYSELMRSQSGPPSEEHLSSVLGLLKMVHTEMAMDNFTFGSGHEEILSQAYDLLRKSLKAQKKVIKVVSPIQDAIYASTTTIMTVTDVVNSVSNQCDASQAPRSVADDHPSPSVSAVVTDMCALQRTVELLRDVSHVWPLVKQLLSDINSKPAGLEEFLQCCVAKCNEVDADMARWLLQLTGSFSCVETIAVVLKPYVATLLEELAALSCSQLHRVWSIMSDEERVDVMVLRATKDRCTCSVKSSTVSTEDSCEAVGQSYCALWALIDARSVQHQHMLQLARSRANVPVNVAIYHIPALLEKLCMNETKVDAVQQKLQTDERTTQQQLHACQQQLQVYQQQLQSMAQQFEQQTRELRQELWEKQRSNEQQIQLLNQKLSGAGVTFLPAPVRIVTENNGSFDFRPVSVAQHIPSGCEVTAVILQVSLFGGPTQSSQYVTNCFHIKTEGHEPVQLAHYLAYQASTAGGVTCQAIVPIRNLTLLIKKEDKINSSSQGYISLIGYFHKN